MFTTKSLLQVEVWKALRLFVSQTKLSQVASYARVTLRDANVSRKIIQIAMSINKPLHKAIGYIHREMHMKILQAVAIKN